MNLYEDKCIVRLRYMGKVILREKVNRKYKVTFSFVARFSFEIVENVSQA